MDLFTLRMWLGFLWFPRRCLCRRVFSLGEAFFFGGLEKG